jgi:hypothetical protein
MSYQTPKTPFATMPNSLTLTLSEPANPNPKRPL